MVEHPVVAVGIDAAALLVKAVGADGHLGAAAVPLVGHGALVASGAANGPVPAAAAALGVRIGAASVRRVGRHALAEIVVLDLAIEAVRAAGLAGERGAIRLSAAALNEARVAAEVDEVAARVVIVLELAGVAVRATSNRRVGGRMRRDGSGSRCDFVVGWLCECVAEGGCQR